MKKFLLPALLLAVLTSCSQYSLVNSDVYNGAELADYRTFRIVTPADGSLPPGMEMVTYYNIAAAIREQLVERGFTEDPSSPILVNIGLTVRRETDLQAVPTPGTWVPVAPGPFLPPPAPQEPQNTADAPYVQLNGGPGPALLPNGPLHMTDQTPVTVPAHNPVPGGPVYHGMAPYFMYPRSVYMPGPTQIVASVYREGVLTMDIVDLQNKLPLYSSSVATILDNGDTQFRNLSGIAQAVKVLFSKFPVALLPQYR